jgi:hypothetical protein
MKIAVLGETILPVLPYGAGGLGRMTYEHAVEFLKQGHETVLYAPCGGEFEGGMVLSDKVDTGKFDVILDCSHDHFLSKREPHAPVLNLIGDRECQYVPPQAVVESRYMKIHYPSAKIVSAGIDTSTIPFSPIHEDSLVFIGVGIGHKQQDVAVNVAYISGKKIIMINGATEERKWEILGNALGLLCPYTIDASPRSPLEAAVCGTPTLCLDGDGTKDHVVNGINGFVCKNKEEMAEKVELLKDLDKNTMHKWAVDNYDIKKVATDTLELMRKVMLGERW